MLRRPFGTRPLPGLPADRGVQAGERLTRAAGGTGTSTGVGHRRDLLRQRLPRLTWHPPEATFLAWLNCADLGPDDQAQERFLSRGRVALEPGLRFGAVGSGYARLNYATSADILDQATARMASSVS